MPNNSEINGTPQKCDCCGTETLAILFPQRGILEIQDRRHGVKHRRTFTLREIVYALDPGCTSITFCTGTV